MIPCREYDPPGLWCAPCRRGDPANCQDPLFNKRPSAAAPVAVVPKPRKVHWMETAVGNGQYADNLLGEDENGFLLVPSRTKPDWWDRLFNPRNPLHWPYYLRSRLKHSIVMLHRDPYA